MQKLLQYTCATFLLLGTSCAFGQVRVESPNREVAIDFLLDPLNSTPLYQVTFRGEQVIKPSMLGVKFPSEDAPSGFVQSGPVTILNVESEEVREDFEQVTGKRRQVHVVGNKKSIRLEHANHPQQTWNIEICAFDDGVAFRYEFPNDEGSSKELVIVDEATEFVILPSSQVQALPLKNFTTSYETRYQTLMANKLPKDSLLALPLLFELPSGSFAAITESDVDEYAGMYLQQVDNQLVSRLSPLPNEPTVAVRTTRPHTSPWRVILLAKEIGRLVESDLVLALAKPCQIADTSWVKSGKTTFPWWNGFYESGVDFKPGLNTETAKHYIEFARRRGQLGLVRRTNRSLSRFRTDERNRRTRSASCTCTCKIKRCPHSFVDELDGCREVYGNSVPPV
jgi:alpha-glucosidase